MSRDMLIALGGGVLSGLISLAFVAGIPGAMLAVYLTPLPLLMIGLGMGLRFETVAGLAGVVTAGVAGGPFSGLLYALIYGLPVWLVVRLALTRHQVSDGSGGTTEQWTPTGTILGMLAIMAAALFALAYVLALSQEGGLQGMIYAILERVFTLLMPGLQDGERVRILQSMAALFPGYLGMSWVVMTIINASIALTVLHKMKAPVRPRSGLSDLVLPDRISIYFIAAATLALVGNLLGLGEIAYIGRNMAMLVGLPFFFLGLAVVHNIARMAPYPGIMLIVFYLVLLLSGWVALIVIAAGLIEQWAGIRRHFKAPGSGSVS
ncbi:MAG TPA: DUF2232 domain-containing protein [Rhodospirillales bacterium]|nr:DUF2232 domain-containing protein [Rhodospirillales bacterium]